jgi:hypothetical protein
MKVACVECDKEAPINKEKSNENWIVHDTNKPCECGGEFKFKFGTKRTK